MRKGPSLSPRKSRDASPAVRTAVRWAGGWLSALLLVGVAVLAAAQMTSSGTAPIRALPDLLYVTDPADAAELEAGLDALRTSGDTSPGSGRLSPSTAYWFRLPLGHLDANATYVAELRLLRAANGRLWLLKEATDSNPPGTALANAVPFELTKGGASTIIRTAQAGKFDLVGQVNPSNVARIKAYLWYEQQFNRSVLIFERAGGVLAGTLVIFALFSATIGALNRDRTFWLFAGWLVTSFRIAAVNDGWDITWMGIDVAATWTPALMRITLPIHAFLTAELFRSLFRTNLPNTTFDRVLLGFSILFGVQCIVAPFLDTHTFLPIIWASASMGLAVLFISLAFIIIRQRSLVAVWYATSWGFAILGYLAEVFFQSGVVSSSVPLLNAQVGFVASALLTGVALAERLRQERAARLNAQSRAVQALRRFKDTYRSVPIGLFTADATGRLKQFNPAFAAMFNLDPNAKPGAIHWNDCFAHGTFPIIESDDSSVSGLELEILEADKGSDARCFHVKALNEDGLLEGSVQDVTETKRAELSLRHLADHDPLTDLTNRRGLDRDLTHAVTEAALGIQTSVGYLDLDRFKLVNDLFGHLAGDHVLRQIAARIKEIVKPPHVVARVGGDEFVLLLRGVPPNEALEICEQLIKYITESPFQFGDKAFSVTGSVGLVALTSALTAKDALIACDRACADAKAHGGSSVVVYSDGSEELRRHMEEIEIAGTMRQKLPVEQFFVQLQPIVSLRTAFSDLNYEVLIRMQGDSGKIISPGQFLAAAERNGIMASIDRWVLEHVLTWLEAHPGHLSRLGFASINLSGASLNDERFVDDTLAMIREHSAVARHVCFEITESVALYDLKNTSRFVDLVKAHGAKVALDDFGAGYTSFNYLKELPADLVKIDGAFIKGINSHRANLAITRSIVDLCHQIGMQVVAEWAETRDVVETLIRLDVDFGQGYALAKPLDLSVMVKAASGGALVKDPSIVKLLQTHSSAQLPTSQPAPIL